MSIRPQQIASTLRHAVQTVLSRGLQDPRVRGLITVTRVEVTPDLAEAFVYVSILPAEQATLTMHGLKSATRRVRGEVGKAVHLRRMPRLSFRLDESLKKQAALDRALKDALDREAPNPTAPQDDADAPPRPADEEDTAP